MTAVPIRREFSEASARVALVAAASSVGLSAERPRLLRLGENAVFELDGVVARVIRASDDASPVERTVRVARWLHEQGIGAVEALDVPQPVHADDLLVTFWESLGDGENYGHPPELAELLRRLHVLTAPADLQLPRFEPFVRAGRRLAAVRLGEDERQFLDQRLEELKRAYADLRFDLAEGVIHEDASVGNVLIDRDGHPRLIDLDGFCIGPREWDLIQTAMYFDRYGWHTAAEYQSFCEIYGFDVMQWSGYETLADLKELLMVSWMAQNAGRDEQTDQELSKRISAVRTGASRRDWEPF